MSQVFKTIQYIFMVIISLGFMFVISGSGTTSNTISPKIGYIQTQQNFYFCQNGSPAAITKFGFGTLKIDVKGADPATFSWTSNLMNNQSSAIDCGSTPNCCVYVQTPVAGNYSMTYFFNVDPCNSQPNCSHWYLHKTFNTNYTLECSWEVVSIINPNPSGLYTNGGC